MFDWFKLFLLSDFIDDDLVSRTLTVFLTGKGEKDILITQGNEVALTVDGVFLPLNFADKNPHAFDGMAVYQDADGYVWLGYEVDA